jgi:hypothetical protein
MLESMSTQTFSHYLEIKMFKALIAVIALTSLSAYAHVLPGHYEGKDQAGNVCSFTVGKMWFENNLPHPLTERLEVTLVKFQEATVDTVWALGHPPIIDTDNGKNRFNHDIFQQIVPNKTGATSLTVIKGEEKEEEEGGKPVGIIFVNDNYKNAAASQKLTCLL